MVASSDRLAQLQRRFFRLITAPEGVGPGLRELAPEDPGAAPLSGWIGAVDEALAIERLDVYANMYFYRLLEVLREDYPKVAALIGDAGFHNLVTDYLLAHPSRHASVRHVGRHLPDFAQSHPLAGRFPGLADLARLEWARGESFDAADATPLVASDLAQVPPEAWADLRLEIIPAVRILELEFPADEIWLALEGGEVPAPLTPARTALVVFRNGYTVYHRHALTGEIAALRALCSGSTFGELCATLAIEREEEGEAAAQLALTLLTRWLEDGLLSAISLSSS